ncbi:MAG TPA: heavy metal translocating P-type ATPase [Candidatus Saccharimonadales bacterium]|nr:heavy metal translocating P-type ATPase [Candidatus Saccharimonadales bacterium]
MLKNSFVFFRKYPLFGVALLSLIAGLVLLFTGNSNIARLEISIVALIEVLPLLWGMFRDLQEGTYGIDILAATAIITSVIMRQYWAAIVVVIMLTGGEALEDYAENRAKTELSALLNKAPKLAHLLKNNKEIDVPASKVQAGDKLIIRPGEVVPVDAVIIDGEASFDESSLTGESIPQAKAVNDSLLSGSVDIDGAITVKALRASADSQYEQIIKLVRAANNSKTPFVRLADRYSIPFTIVAFVLAIGAWVVSHQSIRFLDVLVVATPCPLILAAPIAVISGMSRAARHGVIVKSGGSLERLAETETIAFDKTGTLTMGKPVVDSIVTYNKHTRDRVLSVAAALEKGSNHVLAQAITQMASDKHVKTSKIKNIKEYSGSGLVATSNGHPVLIGTMSLMKDHKIELPKTFSLAAIQQTASLVAIDGILAGVITFKDEIRPEAKGTLKALAEMGIKHLIMITGDNNKAAGSIAKKLGISEFEAETLPADKLRLIEKVKDRPVVFVGDGVNDAPVLTAADVGIALGARGETAASQSADMVIMLDDVSKVATALSIAKRTFSIAQQSILVGIALSIVLMIIFSTGHFRPLYGAIVQELVDVVVIFNALRAHSGSLSKVVKTSGE